MGMLNIDFYFRYYSGHKGKFGHEFLEFDFRPDGKFRYANNSHYKKDSIIKKEIYVSRIVMEELIKMVEKSEVLCEDDDGWPLPTETEDKNLKLFWAMIIFHFVRQKLVL